MKSYLKVMITTALLLGGEKSSVVRQAYEVLQFEKKLASIYEKRDALKKADQLYNRITVGELLTLCPAVSALLVCDFVSDFVAFYRLHAFT